MQSPADDFELLINSVTVEPGTPVGVDGTSVVGPSAGALGPLGPSCPAGPPRPQSIAKVNYSHDGMINLILANRGITQNAIAAHFGYSASWVSQVMSSDAFQAKLLERAQEIEDPTLRATVEDGLKGMLARSMEILKEKLKAEPAAIPDNLALRTLELSSRALGYGAREQTVAVQVNVDAHLEELGGRLTTLLNRKKIEVAAETLPPLPILENAQ